MIASWTSKADISFSWHLQNLSLERSCNCKRASSMWLYMNYYKSDSLDENFAFLFLLFSKSLYTGTLALTNTRLLSLINTSATGLCILANGWIQFVGKENCSCYFSDAVEVMMLAVTLTWMDTRSTANSFCCLLKTSSVSAVTLTFGYKWHRCYKIDTLQGLVCGFDLSSMWSSITHFLTVSLGNALTECLL